MKTRPNTHRIEIERTFSAPVEKLWAAWESPELLARWFGSAETVVTHADWLPAVGSAYQIVLQTVDGGEHRLSGTFKIIRPTQQLVFSWAWATTPERESLVSVEFRSIGTGSSLRLVHEQLHDEAAVERHRDGWCASLEKMGPTTDLNPSSASHP